MNRKTWTPILGTTCIVVAATAVLVPLLGAGRSAQAQATSQSNATTSHERAISVVVSKPERRALNQTLKIPASLEPGEVATLFAKTSGYVLSVKVDIGQRVTKNDVLLKIDVPEMIDELNQAEAVLEAAKAKVLALRAKVAQADSMISTREAEVRRSEAELTLGRITADRQRRLFDEKAIPEQALDEAKSRLAVMEAELQNAKARVSAAEAEKAAIEADVAVAHAQVAVEEANVSRLRTLMAYATIRAPFDGVITQRRVDTGAFVRSAAEGAATPLLTLARVDYVRLVLNIPESDAARVRVGTELTVECQSIGLAPFKVTISRTAGSLMPNTRTMRAEADIDNADGRFMPGLYARTTVSLKKQSQALMIPAKAIRVRGTDITVLVAVGNVARALPVTIGYDDGIWSEITGGLTGSEQVIVSAAGAIAPGAPVEAHQSGM